MLQHALPKVAVVWLLGRYVPGGAAPAVRATPSAVLLLCCSLRCLRSLSCDPTLPSGRYPFREALRAQCAARPAQCRYVERVTEERGVLGSAAGAFVKGLAVYDRAWFCLQPHGDTPTRQAWCGRLLLSNHPCVSRTPFSRRPMACLPGV